MSDVGFDLLATQRAVFKSGLRPVEKLVALALLDHWSRAEGSPFPSVERLAQWTSLGRSTVLRALGGLEATGVLVVSRKNGRSNRYELGQLSSVPVPERHQCRSDTGVTVTPAPVSERHPTSVTVTPEGTKGRNQGKEPIVPRAPVSALSAPSSKQKRPRRSTEERPIPADWKPTAEHAAFAARHGLQLDLEAVGFLGHYDGQEVASPNGRFSTWLANQAKWSRERGAPRAARHVQRGVRSEREAEQWGLDLSMPTQGVVEGTV